MYLLWSLMLTLWATTALTVGSVRKRFFLDNIQHGGMLPCGYGPAGDPCHQGGLEFNGGPFGNPSQQGMANSGTGGVGGQTSTTSSSPTTTIRTATTAVPVALAMTTTAPTSTSPDFCGVAKQLCTANCPGGYLVDPADCTFCICKKDALPG